MFAGNLSISSFRNFDSCEIHFNKGINVLCGKNGSGKTNILEAIFVLLLGRSPRGAGDSVMLKESADFYRLEGEVEINGRAHNFTHAYQKNSRGGRKKITIDQITSRATDLFEKCAVVSAAPEDVELLAGPPAKRREFVNIYLSQASRKYIADLSDYQKVLAQKNAFLKQESNSGDTPYDDLLIKYGAVVMSARNNFLDKIAEIASKHYQKIAGGQKFSPTYKPSVKCNTNSIEIIETAFREKLNRYKEKERVLQTSIVGPHRDEIEFLIGDFPARTHGSQGELRTAAIALKLAVFDYLKKIRKDTPILLLDEIFAELDENRREILVELFEQFGQLFLTTASEIPKKLSQTTGKFKIENGAVFPQ